MAGSSAQTELTRHATSSVFHQRHIGRVLDIIVQILADEALHRHAVENLDQADALLLAGRLTK